MRVESQEQDAFRIYLTESLRLGFDGKVMSVSFADLLHGTHQAEDTRTCNEIVQDVAKKAGLVVVE